MNNKNNNSDPFTAEKLQSTHPQITVSINDTSSKSVENSNIECTPKTTSGAPIKVPVTSSTTMVNKPATPVIKKAISPATDRKIPPYTVTLVSDCVRIPPKPSPQATFIKAAPKVIPEKVSGNKNSTVQSNSPSVSKLPTSNDVKKAQSMQPVRATAQTTTKPADKGIVSSTTTSAEESKPSSSEMEHKNIEKVSPVVSTRAPQVTCRTTNVFEKNIETNVLTFTRHIVAKTPTMPRVNPSKESRTTETNTVNISKASPSSSITTTSASVSTTTTFSPSIPKNTQPKPVMLVTDNLAKNFTQNVKSTPKIDSTSDSKPSAIDKIVKNAKVVIVTSADSSVKTRSPSPSVSSSKLQPESFTVPPSPTIKNLKSNQSPGNFQLNSLSEVEKNKDIINAINSGSTASIGENVTISSAPVEYVYLIDANARSTADLKVRNVSNKTTIEAITKQAINPGSPIPKNKNGNPIESAGQLKQETTPTSSGASSPGESRTPKRSEIPGLLGDGEKLIDNLNALKKKSEEPVECLTISSDEEETEPEQFITSDNNDVSVSILNKEPQMERDEEASKSSDGSAEKEADLMLETTTGAGFTNLICRTVRIGSYKIRPRNGVTISQYGLKIVVPPLNNSNDSVTVKVPIHDIAKVLIHYNRSLPVIFYYINPKAGAKIRQTLKMYDSSYLYFDPNSPDESHRRITLLPEKFTDQDKEDIQTYYLHRDVLDELTHGEANQLLVKSAPKDIQKTVRLPPNPVQTIMVYPPPPIRGGISINTEDYSCLAEDTYLNDVIIDFYLKYLYHEKLTEEDRQKTHIFSSFFYKRLTDKATPVPRALQNSKPNDVTITPAEIRHDRVKKWTKNIDIFSKDYIVIPLNENQHWFLAIICFPGLSGPVRFSDNTPINVDSPNKSEASTKEAEDPNCDEKETNTMQTRRIGSTTITPISGNLYALTDEDGDVEDRDEADGADEDVDEIFNSEEENDEIYSDVEPSEVGEEEIIPKKKVEKERIKQPCILIFDSLKSASRARIIATLREYLHVEYKMKHNGEERDFSKHVVKGACPRVPQQTNYTDCGLFVLHYVEMFFEKKIEDFNIPMRQLYYWFDPEEVGHKRYSIQKLLLRLMQEQKINVDALQLPELNLSPRPCSDEYDDSEDYNDYASYYDDDDEEGHRRMEFIFDEGEEDIEEHDARVRRYMTEEDEDVDVDDYTGEGEDEEEEEGEMQSRFRVFDSPRDDSSSNFSDDDDDDAYRDLDELDIGQIPDRHRQRHTLIEVTGEGSEDDEILHEEEEEVAHEIDEDEHGLRLSNLNKENVTISRMPAGSVSVAVGKSAHNESRSTTLDELKVAEGMSKFRNPTLEEFKTNRSATLEELKAARPLKKLSEVSIERATEDEIPSKRFKSNSN